VMETCAASMHPALALSPARQRRLPPTRACCPLRRAPFPACATHRAGRQGPVPTSAPPATTPPGHPPAGRAPVPRPPFPGPSRPRSGHAPAHRTPPTRTSRTVPPNRYRLPLHGCPCTPIERHSSRAPQAGEGCPAG
jgi:hypothetical protein